MSILGGVAGSLAGGNIGRAVVSLVLDTTGYNSQLEKTKVSTAAATSTMQTSTSQFSGIATAAYATVAVAALGFAKDAIASASEHEQVMAALTAQVGSNTQAFETQATALQNLTGYQDEAILGADTILSRFKLTEDQVRAAIPAVLDFARATGKDVPAAAESIGKALLGNTRALKEVGINYTVTGDRAKDYANILTLLNEQVGGQAAAFGKTFEGKLQILAGRFDDLKEAVGGELIDGLTDVADIVTVMSESLDVATEAVGGFSLDLGGLSALVNPVWSAIGAAADVTRTFGDALGITDTETAALAATMDNADGSTVNYALATRGLAVAQDYAAATTVHLSAAQKELEDSLESAGDDILTLGTTITDTFDVSKRELIQDFHEMFKAAARWTQDMKMLKNLDVGLAPAAQARFEAWLGTQAPAYIDRFLRLSESKQDQIAAHWSQKVDEMNRATASINNVKIEVDTSAIAFATARADRLKQALDRLA